MIAVDTFVEAYPQYNLSIIMSKFVLYIVHHLIYWRVRLTASPPSCVECHEIWEPKPPGTLWATPGFLYLIILFIYIYEPKILYISLISVFR